MPNIGPLELLLIIVGIVVGAVAGRWIWASKQQAPSQGAVIGGLLGVFFVLGWLALALIYRFWHPAALPRV